MAVKKMPADAKKNLAKKDEKKDDKKKDDKKKSSDSSSGSSSSTTENGTWDIEASIAHLNKNAHANTLHYCAKYVIQAIRAGGICLKRDQPSCAKLYHTKGWLTSKGFNEFKVERGADGKETNVQKGDIEVQVYEPYGHICMYNGEQWVSDFRQNSSNVHRGAPQYYYRYGGASGGSGASTGGSGDSGIAVSTSGGGGGGGVGNGIVHLKIKWGAGGSADYPANAKLTKQGWEVAGKKNNAYDPYAGVKSYQTLANKTETLTTGRPTKNNVSADLAGEITTASDLLASNLISTQTVLSDSLQTASDDFMSSLASGNFDPNDWSNILNKSSMNFKSLWDVNKFTGALEAFSTTCKVCGKKVKYIPTHGYCSLKCLMKDLQDQLFQVGNSTVDQLKNYTEENLNVITEYLRTSLAIINDLPDAIQEIDDIPEPLKSYIQIRLNYIGTKMKIFVNKMLIWKNKLFIAWLQEFMNGVASTEGPTEDKKRESTDSETESDTPKTAEENKETAPVNEEKTEESKTEQPKTSTETTTNVASGAETTNEANEGGYELNEVVVTGTAGNNPQTGFEITSQSLNDKLSQVNVTGVKLAEAEGGTPATTSTSTPGESEADNPKGNVLSSINNAIGNMEGIVDEKASALMQDLLSNYTSSAITDLANIGKKLSIIQKYKDKFENEIYPTVYDALMQDVTKIIPSDSFGFMATARAKTKNPQWPVYVDISYPCSVKYSMPDKKKLYNIATKVGISRPKLDKIKKLVDKIVNTSFPPISDYEYLLPPTAFAVRLIFSDQNLTAISKNIKLAMDLFRGEPEMLPKYEKMTIKNIWWLQGLYYSIVPTIQFNFGKIVPPGIEAEAPQSPTAQNNPAAENPVEETKIEQTVENNPVSDINNNGLMDGMENPNFTNT